MKKIAFIIFLVVVILVAIFFLFRNFYWSSYLSVTLKLPVKVDAVDFSKKQAIIKNLRIKNPRGYLSDNAFVSKYIKVTYNWNELNANSAVYDDIIVEDSDIYIICNNVQCNVNNWLNIILSVTVKEREKFLKKITIKKIAFKNVFIYVQPLNATEFQKIKIPNLEINNLVCNEGFPMPEIIAALFDKAQIINYINDAFKEHRLFDKYYKPYY